MLDVDEEWANFISSNQNDTDDEDEVDQLSEYLKEHEPEYASSTDVLPEIPTASNIYISTKTKIAYLNTPIPLADIFWKVPVINYYIPTKGVIKKQMKFNSTLPSEVEDIQEKLKGIDYFEEHVITHIDNPSGRIKFKDIRKISIGISKKDIMSYRCKKRSAFYNCFVIMLRLNIENQFKEFHVKVFNTGKLEIPGVQNEATFQLILNEVIQLLQPYIDIPLYYKPDTEITVLINSNFNCGFYINRESLYEILKYKYNIQAIYDPCSYPGIQCKFYYNPDVEVQTGSQIAEDKKHLYKQVKEVSFMIFRTGSVLIVGKCDESVLMVIYEYLKNVLVEEFKHIYQKGASGDIGMKEKQKKTRRKTLMIEFDSTPENEYMLSNE